LLIFRLDADNVDPKCAFGAGGHAVGLDAARGHGHLRLLTCRLRDLLAVVERQQRRLAGLFAVALGVDLDIAAQHLDGVTIDGLVKAGDDAVIQHHHHQAQTDRQNDDQGPAAVPPDIAPCETKI